MAPIIKNTMFGKYFQHVLVLTFLAGIAYPLPQVKAAMEGAFAFGSETSATAAVISIRKNQAVVTDIKAKVSYDSGHKESNLVVTSSVKITAGASDITLFAKGSAQANLYNKTLKLQGPVLNMSVVSSSLKNNSSGAYIIKKGTAASFTYVGQVGPASMIAGQYEASIVAVFTGGGKLSVSTNKSKPVTIVGEASPFITIAGKGIYGTANKVSVNGVRLGKDIKVMIQNDTYSKTFSMSLKEKATQFSFNLADYAVPPGSYSMFVINTKLGDTAGRSNNVGFTVLNQSKVIIAKVAPGTLALSFDSAKKESLLSAPFSVKVKAANDDLAFNNSTFYVVAQNEVGNHNVTSTVIKSIKSENGTSTPSQPFILKAGTEATFNIVSGINPQTLFAGPYTMSVIGLYPAPQGTSSPVAVQVQDNKTNKVVIIGESSPYITSVNSPVSVGDKVTIKGTRLSGGQILIDGAVLENTIVVGAVDGTVLQFVLPSSFTNGFHQLSVKSDAYGASNTVYFESTGGTDVPPVVVCPAGYICEPVPPTNPQPEGCPAGFTCTIVTTPSPCYVFSYNLTLGDTGTDVSALQKFLISNGFDIPDITSGQNAPGIFGATTKEAVIKYQTSVGQPATGFVGPLTRAALNACTPTVPTPTYPGFFMTLSKSSYSANEKVVAKINRADGNTNPYYVDVYVFGPNLNIPTYSLKKNVGIGQDTEISFQMDQLSPVYSGPGYYSLLLCDGGQKCDGGRNTNAIGFEVKPAIAPPITILSPNGGETYKTGDVVRIAWKTTVKTDSVTIWLSDKYGQTVREIKVPASNTGIYPWTIPQDVVPAGTTGAFKIFMNTSSPVTGQVDSDFSDSPFTITKPFTPPDNSSNSYTEIKPVVSFVSANTNVIAGSGANDDTGVFNIKYKVTAIGGDVYFSGTSYRVEKSGVWVTSPNIAVALSNLSDPTLTANGNYLVEEGDSETIEVTVTVPLSGGTLTSGMYRLVFRGFHWGMNDSLVNTIFDSGLESFITNYVNLN
ncbi:MAG: peptidoglycan-binding domain-containing protein [Patescibacteria group bacterium]